MAPTVRYCCCGCQLKCGSMFVAVVVMISYFIWLVLNCLSVVELWSSKNFGVLETALITIEITSAIECFFVMVFTIILIIGIIKESPAYILPWLLISCVCVVIDTIAYYSFVVTSCLDEPDESLVALMAFLFVASHLVYVLIYCYFLVVVYSFFKSLVDPAVENQYSNVPVPSVSPPLQKSNSDRIRPRLQQNNLSSYPQQQYAPPPPEYQPSIQRDYPNPGRQNPQQPNAPLPPGYQPPAQQGYTNPGQQNPQQPNAPLPPGNQPPAQRDYPNPGRQNPQQPNAPLPPGNQPPAAQQGYAKPGPQNPPQNN